MMMRINGFGYCSSNGSLMKELTDIIGVNPEINFAEPDLKKQLRSSGAFITAGVRAAAEVLSQLSISEESLASAGIIVTSSIGDQNTTSEFIDELFEYGANQGSPLKFAHSIHNAAASYIAVRFKVRGPAFTTVNFVGAFANGITLARCMIEEKVCEHVLLLQIESCSPLSKLLLNYKKNGTLLAFEDTEAVQYSDSKARCEAACFLLSKPETDLSNSRNIFIYPQIENKHIAEYTPLIESPIPESLHLLFAVLNKEEKQVINISGTTYLIEK